MATKPTDTGPWATDTNYPAGAEPEQNTPTKVLPDEEDTVGWRPGQKPPAQKLNRWQNLIYQWMEYLDDGDLTGGVSVTGGLDTDDLAVADDATIGDRLEVIGDIIGNAGAPVNLSASARGPRFYHTTALVQTIPPALSRDPNNTHTFNGSGNGWILAMSANRIVYPISLPVGARITGWALYLNKASNGTHTHSGRLARCHEDGTEQLRLTGDSNNQNSPGATSLNESGSEDIVGQYHYYLILTPAAGTAGDTASHAEVYWTMPPP